MAFNFYKFAKGSFSSDPVEDLEERLNLGLVEFKYRCVTKTDTHNVGDIRWAYGTRNLASSLVPFDDIPLGLKTPSPNVLTYYDLWRQEWRCFDRNALIEYEEYIYIEED